jgi:hypothetical protein
MVSAPLVRALCNWTNDDRPVVLIAQFYEDQKHNEKQHYGTRADSCLLPFATARSG